MRHAGYAEGQSTTQPKAAQGTPPSWTIATPRALILTWYMSKATSGLPTHHATNPGARNPLQHNDIHTRNPLQHNAIGNLLHGDHHAKTVATQCNTMFASKPT